MTSDGLPSGPGGDAELKTRVFAAFEHACRFGEVEVADSLLAIINSRWMKPARPAPQGLLGQIKRSGFGWTSMASR